MIIAVVDDDALVRQRLASLLRRYRCTVVEARDGLEALRVVSTERPDLLLLDASLPVIDGIDVLREIRASPTHAMLPVVVISSQTDRDAVLRFADLGIWAYIVKPLRPREVFERLDPVIHRLATGEEDPATAGPRRPPLALVDSDPNFRAFVGPLLEGTFHVHEAGTGVEGLDLIRHKHPQQVCVGQNLQMLNEYAFARVAREILPPGRTRIHLMSGDTELTDAQRKLFDSILPRTFVPEAFLSALRRIKLLGGGASSSILESFGTALREEIVTAVQQTIGVLMGEDAVEDAGATLMEASNAVEASVRLEGADGSTRLRVMFVTGAQDATRLGSRMLGAETSLSEGALDALGEIVNTIGGRLRDSLNARGTKLEQGSPEVSVGGGSASVGEGELCLTFKTASDERFALVIASAA